MHNQNLSMILGDEMGLRLVELVQRNDQLGAFAPFLLSSCFQRCGTNPPKERAEHQYDDDVILTTYEMSKLPALKSFYSRMQFHYIILDEGHKINGHQTQIAQQAVWSIHADNKLLLTGTPLQNNMVELWSLLQFLYPEIFTISKPFTKAFDLKENIIDKTFLQHAHELFDLFMLRRLKHKVETFIPPKL
ncbi:unnamed protein product [Cylindrotheca closterium]|uniref:Helicase ATP-binding domain-containing protein n=1 Tax=Cylindrotheca closterium TaxID=2856 RepID=A0AAD2G9G0_9STRA|nr:unnamed protein product [Cylindrotheca closterium]